MMKSLGMVLVGAAAIAFLVSRLHVSLPEGVSMPTLPTDILGGLRVRDTCSDALLFPS
jgi:hypothetical protein